MPRLISTLRLNALQKPIVNILLFRIINGKHFLDIGCGDGSFLKLSIKLGAKSVQGIELSQGAFYSSREMK